MTTSNYGPGGSRSPPGAPSHDRATVTAQELCRAPSESHHFGDLLRPKRPHVFRGISCQLGCLPLRPDDPKHEALIDAISSNQVDVIALQELGINFSRAGPHGQWKQRIGWNRWLDGNCSKTVTAFNTTSVSSNLR